MGAALLSAIRSVNVTMIPAICWGPNRSFGVSYAVFSEVPIGPYRADFAVVQVGFPRPIQVAVECDGHEFHEKTKAQARHDKRRDRYFQESGFQIARFAGSEIWADAPKCAAEVMRMLEAEEFRHYDAEIASSQKDGAKT